ncbi:hypothetical protein EIN_249280 [Entamoeba invadens IP1]|uniref:SAM domain-containing protein n=1 Tax=Entamoeba invadens IP1 TaxID=370355 RepID=A0A0A1UGG9_ENTIV|nr:hypothetical protein EIN_249280 [Entamoeba invadens IP1]ELP94894.1 hypothetical protein EIN_249280 [Entamoeba invadens IP1]|eukprot:XP_004261665.1 hypothetical protein EIN_249280 [Entamoeba invadens IP1]
MDPNKLSSISLKSGAKTMKKRRRPSTCQSLPQFVKINDHIPALVINHPDKKIRSVLLYSHDSTEQLDQIHQSLVEMAMLLHCNIIAYEFPGFSDDSTDKYSDSLTAETITKVFEYIIDMLNVPSTSIILFGVGAGCEPTLFLAYKNRKDLPIAGVVLVNPAVSVSNVFSSSPLHKTKYIKQVTAPVGIVVSSKLSDKKETRRLYSLLKHKIGLKEFPGLPQELIQLNYDEYIDSIIGYIVTFLPELKNLFNGEELEKLRPTEYQNNPIEVISHFLSGGGLKQFTDLFISYGYCEIEYILEMTSDEITYMGLNEKDTEQVKKLITEYKAKKIEEENKACALRSLQDKESVDESKRPNSNPPHCDEAATNIAMKDSEKSVSSLDNERITDKEKKSEQSIKAKSHEISPIKDKKIGTIKKLFMKSEIKK